ncbi:MAG TPA: carbohydrate kinase family protein [Deltaproteobacteria bacterium]|nr:carbohydrate kinase family protein [Deltaproteobacteria bacterium]
MTERDVDVLVIGRACVDHLCVVERYPEEDTKVQITQRIVDGGGQGATAACCIARLGGRVAYVGSLGDDEAGRFCLERLDHGGVNTAHVRIVPGAQTPAAYVLITAGSGKRTIVYEPGTLPPTGFDDALKDLMAHARVILLGPQATNLAGPLGALQGLPPVVYDCERHRPGIEDMMAAADYFIPHYGFLEKGGLSLDGASKHERILEFDRMVSGRLVVTDGEHGACYIDEGDLVHVRPPEVAVKDTTGAGDNFHGAFSLALSRGFVISEAVRFAVAVASLSCRAIGGRAGIPDYEQAVAVMNSLV